MEMDIKPNSGLETVLPSSSRRTSANSIWAVPLIIGILMIAASLGGLWMIRVRAMAAYATPQAQEDWEAWRTAVATGKAGDPAVKRRVPKSSEPPTLVLLRDHFFVCASLLVITEAALLATLSIMLMGSFRTSNEPHV